MLMQLNYVALVDEDVLGFRMVTKLMDSWLQEVRRKLHLFVLEDGKEKYRPDLVTFLCREESIARKVNTLRRSGEFCQTKVRMPTVMMLEWFR
jgi:hypothetical protein